ncbi:hypothetical protein LCGC14_1518400 [marine sediment metagenome]|uniref:Uncharacterized protein n=1 Tax=marine sediment metagenome TaxID=412755 RepID=A0A0F9M0F6_9ZZZZ
MKFRTGFVSNSSSASFVIVGFTVDYTSSPEIVKNIFGLSDEDIMEKMRANNYYGKYPEKIKDPEEIKEFCDELLYDLNKEEKEFDCLFGEGSIPDGKIIVGKLLSYIRSEDYGDNIDGTSEFTIEELTTSIQELKTKMKTTEPIKVYTGSMCC